MSRRKRSLKAKRLNRGKFPWKERRQQALERLGFSCYKHYLRSPLWRGIRRRVLERDRWKCCLCERRATQVHHTSYGDVTMRGDRIDRLVSICKHHHVEIEFKGRNKRDFFSVREVLKKELSRKRHRAKEEAKPWWSFMFRL